MFPELNGLKRKASGRMLGHVSVFFDFDWKSRFGHNMAKFPNGSFLGRRLHALGQRTGKTPLLWLTSFPENEERMLENETHVCWVINVDDYLANASRDPSLAYLAHGVDDPSAVSLVKKLLADPDRRHALITEAFLLQLVADWVAEDPERHRAVLRALSSDHAPSVGVLDPYRAVEGLRALSGLGDSDRVSVAVRMLELLGDSTADELAAAVQHVDGEVVAMLATASTLADYRRALAALSELVHANATEPTLQAQLEKMPWVFGSEYSAREDRRTWVRDQQTDFMMRRTTDNHIELIEIKRAFEDDLFADDPSHRGSLYPRPELAKVLGQVMNYLEQIDAKRVHIEADDHVPALKVRAKIIIGRDSADGRQQLALRRLNGHLHRIEVLTYDQLLRIGERTLGFLTTSNGDTSRRLSRGNG